MVSTVAATTAVAAAGSTVAATTAVAAVVSTAAVTATTASTTRRRWCDETTLMRRSQPGVLPTWGGDLGLSAALRLAGLLYSSTPYIGRTTLGSTVPSCSCSTPPTSHLGETNRAHARRRSGRCRGVADVKLRACADIRLSDVTASHVARGVLPIFG